MVSIHNICRLGCDVRCEWNMSASEEAPCNTLAAWDVRRGRVLGRFEDETGIDSFGRLVDQVMRIEPYRSANRVFWVVDNGSVTAVKRRYEDCARRTARRF